MRRRAAAAARGHSASSNDMATVLAAGARQTALARGGEGRAVGPGRVRVGAVRPTSHGGLLDRTSASTPEPAIRTANPLPAARGAARLVTGLPAAGELHAGVRARPVDLVPARAAQSVVGVRALPVEGATTHPAEVDHRVNSSVRVCMFLTWLVACRSARRRGWAEIVASSPCTTGDHVSHDARWLRYRSDAPTRASALRDRPISHK